MRVALPAALDRVHERLFVAGYSWIQERSEAGGMRALRAEVVGRASGTVLEIGAGTGLNVAHYGTAADDLRLVEPAPAMRDVLATAVRDRPGTAVVAGTGERLPAADASVDAVVGTFVLCSVADPALVLREVTRVLRPGGCYLGLEHVRSSVPAVARAQAVVAPGWRVLARGCRCDQDAAALVAASPLTLEEATAFRGPRQPWPVRPGVRIVARRPASSGGGR